MEILIQVKESEAAFFLELVQKFDFAQVEKITSTPADRTATEPTFEAARFNNPGFKFNREEANER